MKREFGMKRKPIYLTSCYFSHGCKPWLQLSQPFGASKSLSWQTILRNNLFNNGSGRGLWEISTNSPPPLTFAAHSDCLTGKLLFLMKRICYQPIIPYMGADLLSQFSCYVIIFAGRPLLAKVFQTRPFVNDTVHLRPLLVALEALSLSLPWELL